MKRNFYYSLVVIALLLYSCNNNETKDNNIPPDTGDTLVPHISKTEKRIYFDLPLDSTCIVHDGEIMKVYGYRRGDLLIVDGDLVFPISDNACAPVLSFLKEDNPDIVRNYDHYPTNEHFYYGVGVYTRQWPVNPNNRIVIKYAIDPDFDDSTRIIGAIKMWRRTGVVDFVHTDETQTDRIYFVNDAFETSSPVGKKGGQQNIKIESEMDSGNIAHEIGHALGLFHEQCRSDRSDFIDVGCDTKNWSMAFTHDKAKDLGTYNFYSIMHYHEDECMTVKITGLPINIPGQRDSITKGDITAIIELYNLNQKK